MLSQANRLSHLGNLIASIYKVRSLTNPGPLPFFILASTFCYPPLSQIIRGRQMVTERSLG